MVTIKDIAREAGIAFQTVSKILNDPNATVSKETRERVLAIAKKMKYRPNVFAKSLRNGRTGIIGITYTGLNQLQQFHDPYLHRLYNGAGKVLSENKYKMIFHSIDTHGDADQALELARQGILDGLIYVVFSVDRINFEQNVQRHLEQLPIPVVLVHSSTDVYRFRSVGTDVEEIAYRSTRHLLQHGYGEVGMVMPFGGKVPMYDTMRAGHARALKEAGITPDASLYYTTESNGAEHGDAIARSMHASGRIPRSMFVISGGLVYGMSAAFKDLCVRMPDDTALLAYSDDANTAYRPTEITFITQAAVAKGSEAARMLLEEIEKSSGESGPIPPVVVEPMWVKSGSCGCDGRTAYGEFEEFGTL